MTAVTSLSGATRSWSPCDEQAGRGAGGEKGEVEAVGGRRDRDEALDLRTAHQQLHADPGAEGDAGDPAGARFRADRLRPVERGRRVGQFALAVIESALRAADAAKIEAQNRKATLGKGVIKVIDDLIIHRAAELRMRMKNDRDRRAALFRTGGSGPSSRPAGPLKITSGMGFGLGQGSDKRNEWLSYRSVASRSKLFRYFFRGDSSMLLAARYFWLIVFAAGDAFRRRIGLSGCAHRLYFRMEGHPA